jgi:phage baseplate assembly protein W
MTNEIEILGVDDERITDRVMQQVRTLILTPEGMLPGSRAFGLPYEFIDMLPDDAVNELAIELEEKVDEFIPEVSVAEVTAEPDTEGRMKIKIFLERRDEDDT